MKYIPSSVCIPKIKTKNYLILLKVYVLSKKSIKILAKPSIDLYFVIGYRSKCIIKLVKFPLPQQSLINCMHQHFCFFLSFFADKRCEM